MEAFDEIRFSVSATTRAPRAGETDGLHYHFLTNDEFDTAIQDGRFLEWEEVYPGCRYGTLREEVAQSGNERPVLLDIDVEGALHVKELFGDRALTVFIRPPSLEVLQERLQKRSSESSESLQLRLETAARELLYEPRFDRVIVNEHLPSATEGLIKAVKTFLEDC